MSTIASDMFLGAPVRFQDVGTAEIACRTFGVSDATRPILLLHGWPLWGFTFRKILPRLTARHTCHVVDLPGGGSTRWRVENDFSFTGQARNIAKLVDALGLERFHIVAHDTGATIAREVALLLGERVEKLALINTEIPGHRPPWIRLFQRLVVLPGAGLSFRTMLRSRAFVRSSLCFGNCFVDRDLISGEFEEQFVRPLIRDPARMEGQRRYLRGIDWRIVDGLAEGHGRIKSQVLLIWGEEDPTFPIDLAWKMIPQFASCKGLKAVPGAKLLAHEEQPEAVADHILQFLREDA